MGEKCSIQSRVIKAPSGQEKDLRIKKCDLSPQQEKFIENTIKAYEQIKEDAIDDRIKAFGDLMDMLDELPDSPN